MVMSYLFTSAAERQTRPCILARRVKTAQDARLRSLTMESSQTGQACKKSIQHAPAQCDAEAEPRLMTRRAHRGNKDGGSGYVTMIRVIRRADGIERRHNNCDHSRHA